MDLRSLELSEKGKKIKSDDYLGGTGFHDRVVGIGECTLPIVGASIFAWIKENRASAGID